ncbi:metallophosphoesterase [Sutcliffiella deserti]|uniref:metallophosphoesterase n=1 Tax=Sutcliffiella deserti TaxID=2875501 RepID=UPI001CBF954C|nr:metallophosphoesterase [Sutcliffiella deserti]
MIWYVGGAVVISGMILLLYMFMEAKQQNIKEQTLAFEEFPKSFGKVRIFFISDIHRRRVTEEFIQPLINKVDFVIIGGDLVEKGVSLKQVEQNIETLKKLGLVFFVWGNNDYEVDYHELDSLLLHSGVKILDNTAYKFESEKKEMLEIVGVDDMIHERDRLDLALGDTTSDSFKILVSHGPKIVEKFSAHQQISLVLSGHTHGGQIRIFGYGPHEKGSIQHLSHTTLLVSNGFGTSLIPLRLGAPPEVHLLTITGH